MAFEEAHVSARSGLNNRSAASLVRSDTYEEPELVLNQLATSQQSRCCVGSVFILAKETDGSFREVPGLSGQHLSFISGGYDKVLVALSSPAGTGDCQSHQHSHATQWVSGSGKQCLEELETTGSGPSAHMGRSKGHSGVCTKNEVDLRSSDAGPCRQSPEVPTHPTGQSKWPLDRIRGTEVHYAETHNRRHWICHACSSVPNRINRFYPSQWPRVFCRRDGGSKRRGVLRDSCFEDIFSSGTADSPFASEEITWACPGPSHFLILTSSGRLYSSGYSAFGCVGRGGVSGGNIPLAVPTLQDFCVTQACVGKSFSLALTAQGEVYSWGGGFQGQLGRVPEEVSLVPRFLQRLMQIPIKTLACNESHVLAVTREGGQCFGWGSNDCGQLGLGRRCPAQPIPQLVEIKKQRTACFFKDRQSLPSQTTDMLGNVLSVEQRGKDRMEDGPSRAFSYGEKDSVVVSEVAAGWRHSLALTVDGDVYAWGLNICGQLGLGHRRRTDTPTLVPEYEPQIRCMRSSQTLSSPSCLHRGRPSNLLSCTCRPLSSPSHQNTHSAQAIGSPNPSSFGAVSPCCAPTCCLSPSLCRASDAFACLGSNCKGPHSKHFPGSDCEQTATGGSRPATRNLGITSLREIWRLGDGTERGGKQQLRPRVRQICVGRLFSGFLLDDGRVLVSGRFPSGREEATRENLSRGILCVTEKSKREVEACLTPTVVPGLGRLASSMIASSNETLMAFAACQILELRPRLLPVPGSTPLPPVLRLRLSALPPVSRLDTYKAAIVPALRARPAEMENEQGNSPKRSPAMDERGGSGCWSLGEPDVPERTSDSDCFTRERATKGRPQTAKADEYPGKHQRVQTRSAAGPRQRLSSDIFVRLRPASEDPMPSETCPLCSESLGHSGEPDSHPGCATHSPTTVVVAADTEFTGDAREIFCECPPLPDHELSTLPSQVGKQGTNEAQLRPLSASPTACSKVADDPFASREFFEPATPVEEEQARAYHASKTLFESRSRHIFPYVAEVSIDGGCCWSRASEHAPEARVLFAHFPQRVTYVKPNNITVDGGLLLTIFLDYLPLGVPEDDIVARFTCIRRPVAMATGIYFSPSSSHRDSVSNLSSGALPCFPSSAMWRANSSGSYRSIRRRAWGLADAVKAQPGMARLDTSALELSSARYTVNLRGPQPAPVPEAPSCQRSIDDSFGSLHEMMLGRVRQACSYFDGGSGGLRSYMLDELEMEPDFSYSVFVPAKIVTVKRDNAEEERGVGEQHGSKTKGKQTFAIQCVSPRLEPMVLNDFDTFIDVGLNGVHFTERPKSLRVVDIHILGISPDVGSSDRRTRVQIEANECFESENTVVLLRYPDATEDVLPAHVDTKSHRISFWMPPKKPSQRLPTGPGKDPAGVIDEVSKFSTEPVVSDEASGGHNSPIAHEADGGFVPSNQVDHKGQISVFLSFNGQVFSRQPAVFTYYSPDLCTQHVIAYTISENGDLFDVDLDNVMSPQTHIVVSVQSAIASNSAQVRLTILRSGNPAARDFLSCLHDEMSPVAAVSSSTDTDNYTPSTMSSAHEVASPPEQAVERVLYLPAVIDVDPQPLTLLPDPNRVKRKPAGSRATDSQRGKAGSATANSAGARAKTKAVPGGGAGIPGMANFTGGGQEGKTPAVGLGGPREQTGSAAGRNATSSGGPTLRARRREKAENSGLEAADEKPRDPTLTFVTPELTFPALTLEEEQVETSEDFVFAVCSVSLDGQRFIPVNEARILRLQCIRLRPSQEDAVPAGGGGGDGRTSSPDHVKPRKKGLPPE